MSWIFYLLESLRLVLGRPCPRRYRVTPRMNAWVFRRELRLELYRRLRAELPGVRLRGPGRAPGSFARNVSSADL